MLVETIGKEDPEKQILKTGIVAVFRLRYLQRNYLSPQA